MRLVPISGKAGHGKDTIAGMIKAFLESNGKKKAKETATYIVDN